MLFDMAEKRLPVSTVGGTFAPMVTTASFPEQPVASAQSMEDSPMQESRVQSTGDVSSQSGAAPGRSEAKRSGLSKGRRRDEKDEGVPKPPLTGYIRYLNEHREKMRKEQPDVPFAEVTKILGVRWTELSAEEKEQYRSEAQVDKVTYNKELEAYRQTEAYTSFMQKKALMQKQQREGMGEMPGFSLPIFTEEFLDYNKGKDLELMALRRANAECEQKNSLLEDHIQQLKKVAQQMDSEAEQRQAANVELEGRLNILRTTLIGRFCDVPMPDTGMVPNNSTVDAYMGKLQAILTDPVLSAQHRPFLEQVKKIMNTIDLEVTSVKSSTVLTEHSGSSV